MAELHITGVASEHKEKIVSIANFHKIKISELIRPYLRRLISDHADDLQKIKEQ